MKRNYEAFSFTLLTSTSTPSPDHKRTRTVISTASHPQCKILQTALFTLLKMSEKLLSNLTKG